MAREFSAYVILRDPKSKQSVTFAPGDAVPAWANVGDHVASQGVTRSVQTTEGAPANDENTDDSGVTTEIVTPEHELEADEESTELPPYEEWSKTDLRAEVDGREIELPKRATVDELVEALKADDAANPEAE